jgi:cyclin A
LEDYGYDIHKHLLEVQAENDQADFLARHSITTEYRAKMVDWMAEVLHTFSCSDATFFLAVSLMDRYFKQCEQKLESGDLHLIGVVSMFIASKYEDVIPLLMKTVIVKIGHNKFNQNQIELMELEMLRTLSFKLGVPTVKEFTD